MSTNRIRYPYASSSSPSRSKPAVVVALLIIGACGVGLVLAGFLWNAQPAYWEQSRAIIQTSPPQALREIAEQAEYRVLPEWSAPIGVGDGVRTVSVSFDEVNAWLAIRLDEYLRNQGAQKPPGVGDVILIGREGELVFAFDYDTPRLQQIVSVFMRFPASEEDPSHCDLRVTRVTAGRLPLPMEQLAAMFVQDDQPDADPGLRAVLDQVVAGRPVGPLILPVDDQREALVRSVVIRDTGLDVTVLVSRKTP